ncbi:MAG: tautomerase family protein [Caulobacterales bacterium]|nr:tautomerase family protein [Caulobacterales bacterium]
MPEIIVYAVEGRTAEAKRALLRDITDAVVRNFAVAPDLVTVQIVEAAPDSKSKGGIPYSTRPPGDIIKS